MKASNLPLMSSFSILERPWSAGGDDHALGAAKPRVGVSACLLGEPVRFDGGNKRDAFLVDQLSPFVDWAPLCPELALGLGTPREALRLTGTMRAPRLAPGRGPI